MWGEKLLDQVFLPDFFFYDSYITMFTVKLIFNVDTHTEYVLNKKYTILLEI